MILMRFSFLFLVNKKCHQSLQNSQLKVYHYMYYRCLPLFASESLPLFV